MMKPKIARMGLIWVCKGYTNHYFQSHYIIGVGNSPKEAYKDFLVKCEQWKYKESSETFHYGFPPTRWISHPKCLACNQHHPANMPCPCYMTHC